MYFPLGLAKFSDVTLEPEFESPSREKRVSLSLSLFLFARMLVSRV